MALQWLLVCHGLVTLLVIVSFLCGQWPIFQGTFIQRIHFFITFGAFDYFRYSSPVYLFTAIHCLQFADSHFVVLWFKLICNYWCCRRRFIHFVCGSRGTDALLSVEYYCCDRPNPIIQVLFAILFSL